MIRYFAKTNVMVNSNTPVSLESNGKRYIGILKMTKKKMYVQVHEIQQLNNNERVTELNKELVRKYFYWEDIDTIIEEDGQHDLWLRIFMR